MKLFATLSLFIIILASHVYVNAQDTLYNNLNVPSPTLVDEEEQGMFSSWDNVELDPYKFDITTSFQPVFIKLVDDNMGQVFTCPHPGQITSHYGYRWHRMHRGTDIDCETGDIIKAAFSGVVRIVRYHSGFGNMIILRHSNGLETLYAHLSGFLVSEGDNVYSGQEIGLGGNTGHSTGSHLHFEIRYKGNSIDSRKFINWETRTLHMKEMWVDKNFFSRVVPPKTSSSGTPSSSSSYPSSSPSSSGSSEYYIVKRGDTLTSIASKNNISVAKLCSLNHITRSTTIQVGRRLKVQ